MDVATILTPVTVVAVVAGPAIYRWIRKQFLSPLEKDMLRYLSLGGILNNVVVYRMKGAYTLVQFSSVQVETTMVVRAAMDGLVENGLLLVRPGGRMGTSYSYDLTEKGVQYTRKHKESLSKRGYKLLKYRDKRDPLIPG